MSTDVEELTDATGAEVRAAAREGRVAGTTAGMAMGYAQANLVVLPWELAFDFLLFCGRNRKACPVLDVTDPGSPEPRDVARRADVRTDLPRYRVYVRGELVDEPTDITGLWRSDFVAFLIGCSFTFEGAMRRAGLPVRHLEEGKNVPMYRTRLECKRAGGFFGPLVVSMRPLTSEQAVGAVRVTSRYPDVHGAPIHLGDPAALGISDLARPDFGDAVTVRPGEIPVFWACGVTPQAVAIASRPEIMITHSPGCMFVTDIPDESLALG